MQELTKEQYERAEAVIMRREADELSQPKQ
jgi:hypothetical protein